MAFISTLSNSMKIWEAFCLQAGSHNVNASREMAPHCAGSCTNMKEKVGCQEIWSWKCRRGLGSLCDSVDTPGDSCLLRGRFSDSCLWMITLGTKGWKQVEMSAGMSCQGRCCVVEIKSSWSGAVRWKNWQEMEGRNVFTVITYSMLLPVTLV